MSLEKSNNPLSFLEIAKRTITIEKEAIDSLITKLNHTFEKACQILLGCTGHTIVTGIGKSGHIARKIAATLASTGTPAFFVHPGEAHHGDLGMITSKEVVLAFSNSGETGELLKLIPFLKQKSIPLILITGKKNSKLARAATVSLDVAVPKEACPLGLAPTSSTTAALVMGDALAIALLEHKNFNAENFASFHPGGMLGRDLLVYVQDLMHTGTAIPQVPWNYCVDKALIEMTQKSFGLTAILSSANYLLGVFTDGDLRRTLDAGHAIHTTPIVQVMTSDVICISPTARLGEAKEKMQKNKVSALLVTESIGKNQKLVGILHMHDLLRVGAI